MYAWLVGRVIRSLYRKLSEGRVDAVVKLAAPQVELVVPGTTAWSGSFHGRDAYETWLRGFVSVQPQLSVRDVVVSGGPWNTRIAVRMTETVGVGYRNECVDYLRLRWGKVRRHEVFLDTQCLAELSTSLANAGAPAAS
jgi:ketosteroid isomerase-like protein